MEIGFAHVLNQKVFLLNPIPEIPYYKSEIEAVKPVILNGDLSKISEEIKLGTYKHFKRNSYEVIEIGRHSETLEEFVVYKALYGERDVWVRPKTMFLEKVSIDGKEVPRFEFIG
ncbi:hypothetical protein COV17_01795 [Candidatus Woesearchaeota archaeon CG10_big_fil_rev_8_21_14_0_10_36_11]|nr:MAG: hypothetical protein COV17_01795 [Candidatus Woesearchaeota archaeon CG10_big_fil_rev_8_21_14_0_10_36_11]